MIEQRVEIKETIEPAVVPTPQSKSKRTKPERAVKPSAIPDVSDEIEDRPLEVFEIESSRPYITEYLQDNDPVFDYHSVEEELELIDSYLKEEIRVGGEKPMTKNYIKHYKKLMKKLGSNKDATAAAIIHDLSDFIKDFNVYRRRFEREMRERVFENMLKEAKINIREENKELFEKLTLDEQEDYLKKRNLWA